MSVILNIIENDHVSTPLLKKGFLIRIRNDASLWSVAPDAIRPGMCGTGSLGGTGRITSGPPVWGASA